MKLFQVVKMDLSKIKKENEPAGSGSYSGSVQGNSESFLGKSVKFKGNITSEESIMIEGKITGNISSDREITIGAEGNINGRIDAGVVNLLGAARGEIVAKQKINIRNAAKFNGNMTSDKVTIEEGGIFNGNMNMPERKQR